MQTSCQQNPQDQHQGHLDREGQPDRRQAPNKSLKPPKHQAHEGSEPGNSLKAGRDERPGRQY